jgi:hypothetical protein
MGSKRRRSNLGLAKPGRIFRRASTLPGGNSTRPMAANSAGHGAWTGAAVGDHHSLGHPLAFAIPHRGSGSHD